MSQPQPTFSGINSAWSIFLHDKINWTVANLASLHYSIHSVLVLIKCMHNGNNFKTAQEYQRAIKYLQVFCAFIQDSAKNHLLLHWTKV